MSTRCRNDLVGAKGRVASSVNAWRESIASIQEVWSDTTAQRFYSTHFTGMEETLTRMIASLQEAADMVRSFERALQDDDR